MLGTLLQLLTEKVRATGDGVTDGDQREAGQAFGPFIQGLRREGGLTQRQLAAELDIDFTYLSKLENGRGEAPGEKTVRKLAEILRVDAEELLALAGRLPPALREKARNDVEFARFLRQLPDMTDEELRSLYSKRDRSDP